MAWPNQRVNSAVNVPKDSGIRTSSGVRAGSFAKRIWTLTSLALDSRLNPVGWHGFSAAFNCFRSRELQANVVRSAQHDGLLGNQPPRRQLISCKLKVGQRVSRAACDGIIALASGRLGLARQYSGLLIERIGF